jgi:hypothetical protein
MVPDFLTALISDIHYFYVPDDGNLQSGEPQKGGNNMSDVKDYCNKTHKRLIGLKAGLYDVIVEAEKKSDKDNANQAKQLKTLIEHVQQGIEELNAHCPPDWTPKKEEMDDSMNRLSHTLSEIADRIGVSVPDTTAWL